MGKKGIITTVAVLIVLVIVFFAAKSFFELREYRNIINTMVISDIDLSQVPDGVYGGSFDTALVSAEVKVTVGGHGITGIELVRHDHGRGEAAEVIPQKIMEAQSLNVDIITGATSSSKVILKAVERALTRQD